MEQNSSHSKIGKVWILSKNFDLKSEIFIVFDQIWRGLNSGRLFVQSLQDYWLLLFLQRVKNKNYNRKPIKISQPIKSIKGSTKIGRTTWKEIPIAAIPNAIPAASNQLATNLVIDKLLELAHLLQSMLHKLLVLRYFQQKNYVRLLKIIPPMS